MVAKFGGDSSNPSMPTRKCWNITITLRVKLGFAFWGTSKCPIGTKLGAAPLLKDYAKVAKIGGDSSNPFKPTRNGQNVTLRVKLGFAFWGTSKCPIST